jgi:hypothetical protein
MKSFAFATMAAALSLVPLCARAAPAFEMLGLRSGMTVQEVQSAAPAGFHLGMFDANSGGITDGKEIYATVAFCGGRLVDVTRGFDADVDWPPAVQRALRERGQPTTSIRETPWPGPGGGTVSSVVMSWTNAKYRYELDLWPEGRDGRGNLRHTRGASVSMYLLEGNACDKAGSR